MTAYLQTSLLVFRTDIDQNALENAAKIANLHDFVINNLANGYSTKVGERGIRLWGQRQRIGIARVLYHNPKLLILDEATSALDTLTEKAVMDAVTKIGKNITTILIAHRLSTVRNCDKFFYLRKVGFQPAVITVNLSISVRNLLQWLEKVYEKIFYNWWCRLYWVCGSQFTY